MYNDCWGIASQGAVIVVTSAYPLCSLSSRLPVVLEAILWCLRLYIEENIVTGLICFSGFNRSDATLKVDVKVGFSECVNELEYLN